MQTKYIAYYEDRGNYIVWGIGNTERAARLDAYSHGYKKHHESALHKLLCCKADKEVVEYVENEGGGEVPMRIVNGKATMEDHNILCSAKQDIEFLKAVGASRMTKPMRTLLKAFHAEIKSLKSGL